MHMRGKFIAIEHIDASGGTTQANRLAEHLRSKGKKVWVTAEPSDSEIGVLIRKVQRGECVTNCDEYTMMYLYAADRSIHCKEIEEHLNRGEWVICDRYKMSSYAYQDFLDKYATAYEVNYDFLDPDLTIIISISVEESMRRLSIRGGKTEIFENAEFLKKVREKYIDILNSYPYTRVCDVNGEDTIENVTESIIRELEKHGYGD